MRDDQRDADNPVDRRGFLLRGLTRAIDRAAEAAMRRAAPALPVVEAMAADRFPLRVDRDRCIAHRGVECGVCARVCPVGSSALSLDANGRPVPGDACTSCGACVTACVTAPPSLSLRGQLQGEIA